MQTQKYAIGYKNITANDNFFTGHFPERKIMPGIICSHTCVPSHTTHCFYTAELSTFHYYSSCSFVYSLTPDKHK